MVRLSPLHVNMSDSGEEVVITGLDPAERVVARIATLDLERYFGRMRMSADEARRIVAGNISSVEHAIERKCGRGDFHHDCIAGRPVSCVHLHIRDIVDHGDAFFESPADARTTGPARPA